MLGGLLLGLNAALYTTAATLMQANTSVIEKEEMITDVGRIVEALRKELETLRAIANDYAAWDDTYVFMQDRNPSYLTSNFAEATLANYDLNVLVIADMQGEPVFERALDLSTHRYSSPHQLSIPLNQDLKGILLLQGKPLLLVSSPILTSHEEGPQRGWVIMGRFMDDSQTLELARQTKLNLQVQALQDFPDPDSLYPEENLAELIELVRRPDSIQVEAVSPTQLVGCTVIRDLQEQPALVLKVISSRPIYAQLQHSLRYLGWSLWGAGSVVSVMVLVFVERAILSRLGHLNQGVNHIRNQADLSTRFALKGRDELAVLGQTLNEMLARLQQTQFDLEQSRQDAEAANRIKSEFLAMMSHEIRTPMHAVIGMTDLLQNTRLDDLQQNYVTTIRTSGSTLLTILNDILDFSKIEAGRFEVIQQPMNLHQCISQVAKLFRGIAEEKGLQFLTQIDFSPSVWISGDETRLSQILGNLLSNAVKFTTTGSITLAAKLVTLDPPHPSRALLQVSVQDTGIGISAAQIARLFQPFTQADSSTTRHFGGTGLGLVISHRLCQLMQGRLRVESQLGEGSTFWIEMPVQPIHPPVSTLEVDITLPHSATSQPLRILLAEDNVVNQKVALHMLKRLGYSADIAVNGVEVLQKLDANLYDVILMDLHMPEMDGLTAAEIISHRHREGNRPYIIAMTASTFAEDRERCQRVGMQDFLSKPVKLAALAQSLYQAQHYRHHSPASPVLLESRTSCPIPEDA
jgi:signal transduction histidine kinase/ActR/RegA family two-component response regulator